MNRSNLRKGQAERVQSGSNRVSHWVGQQRCVKSRVFWQQNAGRKGCNRNQAMRQLQGTKCHIIPMRVLKRSGPFVRAAWSRNMN